MSKAGVVNIRGKEYKTVALRVNEFRSADEYLGCAIITDLISANDQRVVMKAWIVDEQGRQLATGFAEEDRSSSNINKTSALENAETSAIGRALANLGLAGTEYASADEVANAMKQQASQEALEPLLHHNAMVREHLGSISVIKGAIACDDIYMAIEAYLEIPKEDLKTLWVAPSKGGVFTTAERQYMRTDEFNAALKAAVKEIADEEG